MAHDGLALAIRPVNTPFDGDTVFTLSTASDPSGARPGAALPFAVSVAGATAARVLARAVADAIRSATTLHGVPALRDLPFAR